MVEDEMLLLGDCRDLLPGLAANSVEALVTDPPGGINFMGLEFDSDRGGRLGWVQWLSEVLGECRRVMKPGAFGLVWAYPRTAHWTMTALEDAGFELRDVITHVHGGSFPKSEDISKGIDKVKGAAREVVGVNKYAARRQRKDFKTLWVYDPTRDLTVTKPATPEAMQWDGWGTNLKNCAEFWVLCRKPLETTTTPRNVLEWGTGGINIKGSLVPPGDRYPSNFVMSHSPLCDTVCAPGCPVTILGDRAKFYHTFAYASKAKPSERGHPTVKSQQLMEFLVKLITPPGGTVLDPFAGSGSTILAAKNLGFNAIGIEIDEGYYKLMQKRLQSHGEA